jgi:hypothetical protein
LLSRIFVADVVTPEAFHVPPPSDHRKVACPTSAPPAIESISTIYSRSTNPENAPEGTRTAEPVPSFFALVTMPGRRDETLNIVSEVIRLS